MKKFIFFILIFSIVGVVVYSVVTQIAGTIHFGGLLSTDIFDYSSTLTPPSNHVSVTVTSTPSPPLSSENDSRYADEPPRVTPPSGFTQSDLSPYYGKIRLLNVVTPRGYYDARWVTQFTLQGADSVGMPGINVTGWHVKGNSGAQVFVPQAIDRYFVGAYGSPRPGDIYLSNGDYLTVYSSKSPVGANIRLNKCTGYLNSEHTFSPPLPQTCPSVDRSAVVTFSGECQSYIFSLYGCAEPTPNKKNRLSYDAACAAFLNTLNYQSCFAAHRNDYDFLGHEWRAWVDREMPFNPEHDRILLLDKNGLLVDVYTY